MNFWRRPSKEGSSGEGVSVLDERVMQLVAKWGTDSVSASLQRCRENHKEMLQEEKSETLVENFDSITPQQERELNRTLLDASFEAVVLSNARGRIIKVNRSALRVLGYSDQNELLGQSVSVMVGGGEAKYHDEYFEKYRRRG
jgi:PAS domain-containing protein